MYVEGLLFATCAQVQIGSSTHASVDSQAVARSAQAIGERHCSGRRHLLPATVAICDQIGRPAHSSSAGKTPVLSVESSWETAYTGASPNVDGILEMTSPTIQASTVRPARTSLYPSRLPCGRGSNRNIYCIQWRPPLEQQRPTCKVGTASVPVLPGLGTPTGPLGHCAGRLAARSISSSQGVELSDDLHSKRAPTRLLGQSLKGTVVTRKLLISSRIDQLDRLISRQGGQSCRGGGEYSTHGTREVLCVEATASKLSVCLTPENLCSSTQATGPNLTEGDATVAEPICFFKRQNYMASAYEGLQQAHI